MQVYFKEIKNRIVLIFLSQAFSFLSLYYYKNILLFSVVHPVLAIRTFSVNYFIITDILELISVYLNLILFINDQLMAFVFFYHFLAFSAFGWYKEEFLRVAYLSKIIFCFWVTSNIATHFILLPFTWLFFIDFYILEHKWSFNLYFEPKLIEYLQFYKSFYWSCFWYFQFIGLLFFFLGLPNATLSFVQKYRKLFYFCFTVIASAACPDTISQFTFILILLLTYEFNIARKLIRFR